jgi:MYXO-CTERM domain-containing protein
MEPNMKNLNTILAVGAVTAACGAAEAALQTIAGWDFSTIAGVTAPNPGTASGFGANNYAASASAAGLSVGGLTRGSGVSTTLTNGGSSASKGWGGVGLNGTADAAAAIASSKFIFFTITTDSNTSLSISSIDAYNVRRSSSGATSGQWQFQVGAGAYSNIGSTITWGSTTTSSGNAQSAIDLTGVSALQGIAANTTVTFRLALWGASSATGTWYLNGQSATVDPDFKLSGEVTAVPAPGAIALLGVAGLVSSRRRR